MCPLGLQRGAARTPSIIAHLTPSTLRLGKKTTLHTRAPPASALRVCRRSRARHGAPSLSTLSAAVLASTAPPATARRASCAQGSRHGVCACARGGDDAERVRREAAARREGPKGKGAPDPAALPTVVVCSQSPHPPIDLLESLTQCDARARAVGCSKKLAGRCGGMALLAPVIGYGIGTYRAAWVQLTVAACGRPCRPAHCRNECSGRRGLGCVPSACD